MTMLQIQQIHMQQLDTGKFISRYKMHSTTEQEQQCLPQKDLPLILYEPCQKFMYREITFMLLCRV